MQVYDLGRPVYISLRFKRSDFIRELKAEKSKPSLVGKHAKTPFFLSMQTRRTLGKKVWSNLNKLLKMLKNNMFTSKVYFDTFLLIRKLGKKDNVIECPLVMRFYLFW